MSCSLHKILETSTAQFKGTLSNAKTLRLSQWQRHSVFCFLLYFLRFCGIEPVCFTTTLEIYKSSTNKKRLKFRYVQCFSQLCKKKTFTFYATFQKFSQLNVLLDWTQLIRNFYATYKKKFRCNKVNISTLSFILIRQ